MIVDLHNHTPLCNHCEGIPREFIKKAIEEKIDIFGFSDHAPMKFDKKYRMSMSEIESYEIDIKELKEEFKNNIEILIGYEVDFLHNYMEEKILKRDVDYLIGSIHFINKWGFDNPEFIGEYQNRDIDKIWEEYFDLIKEMAKSELFDIVGHLDLIKVFKFLPKKDIRVIAKEALKAIKKANMSIEINSAGLRKPIAEQYPSKELMELIYDLNIDITFGSDAHLIDQIGFKKDEVLSLVKKIGFDKCAIYREREKIMVTI